MMQNKDEVESLESSLRELLRMRSGLNEEIYALEQRIANALAAFKIGQRVLYRGKGEYEITGVRYGYGLRYLKYFGRKVLKSGMLHAHTTELYVYDETNDLTLVEKAQ